MTKKRIRSNRNTTADLTVIILFILAGLMAFYLYSTSFTMNIPNGAKEASPYKTQETMASNQDNLEVLNEKTDILGQTVYAPNGDVLGIMYDAYVDAKTGEIKWISINVNGDYDTPLVMIASKLVQSYGHNEPAIVNLSKEELLEYPVQQKYEEKLAGHISVRALPGTHFNDSAGTYNGEISYVTYNAGKIDKVFMIIGKGLSVKHEKLFSFDFEDVAFTLSDNYYDKKAGIILSDIQAGAILAFIEADQR